MTLQDALKQLETYEQASYAIGHAMGVVSTDGATAAPRQSYRGRGRSMAYLGGLLFDLSTSPANVEAVRTILDAPDADAVSRRKAQVIYDSLEDLLVTPREEYVAFEELLTEADAVWHRAKEEDDWPAFEPYLEKLVDFQYRLAQRKRPGMAPYDALLDTYEKGLRISELDPFFALLRDKLTPVIQAVSERPAPDDAFLREFCPAAAQRAFSDKVMRLIGLDPERCTIAETEHPFTSGSNKWDVRITTRYREHDVLSSMYSVIHEGGHALYELGVADEWQFTVLSGGSSMSIHESQSRFYENLIGRSRPFMTALLPLLKECFPHQFEGVTADQLYRAANKAQPSLIRTEADELTYPIHVMIRYELEKALFAGQLKVKDLPAAWGEAYHRYLGVTVPNNRDGVLQDSHWSGASFGYFPSYALGSAYGVQMLESMEKELDVWGHVERGDLAPITAWLDQRIHRYGMSKTPKELLRSADAAPFIPEKYVSYLTRKFSDLYNL